MTEHASTPLRIFVSYRRDETSGHAGRLYDALSARFGSENVFMDVDAIDLGADFTKVIDRAVTSCDVLIALIGRGWLGATDAAGQRRLEDPDDFVRIELASALARDVFVIPACVQGASIPSVQQLPEPLAPLARRQGVELRDSAWHDDVRRLVRRLERLAAENAGVVERPLAPAAQEARPRRRRLSGKRLAALGVVVAGFAGTAVALALALGGGDGTASAARLRALVPAATRPSCTKIDYGAESAKVSLECSGARVAVAYHLFGSADAMSQWYALRREEAQIEPGSGSCGPKHFRGEASYAVGDRDAGSRFCFVDSDGETKLVWTDLRSGVGAEANVWKGTGPAAARSLLRQWLCCFRIAR